MRAPNAFAATTYRSSLLGQTRVDDPGIGIVTARTSHFVRVSPEIRRIGGVEAVVTDESPQAVTEGREPDPPGSMPSR